MPGKTRPARHERVVTIANRVGVDVAEVGARTGSRLLGHPDRFISREEEDLRTVDVMRFDENAIPSGVARAGNELGSRDIVTGHGPGGAVAYASGVVDKVAVALAEPRAVRSVLSDNLDIEVLPEVELSDEAFAAVTLVPGT